MSNKILLTENEMRRFMKLANIPALNENASEEPDAEKEDKEEDKKEAPEHEKTETPDEETAEDAGEETDSADLADDAELGDLDVTDADGESKEQMFKNIVSQIAELIGVEADVSDDAGEAADADKGDAVPPTEPPMPGAEQSTLPPNPAVPDGEEELEMDDDEKDPTVQEMRESKIIEAVLARVTARLVAEAKKNKAAKDSMKAKAATKTVVKEANAPAPKETKSNGEKNGLKAAGKATKGTFGVTSKISDQEWKAGKEGKGSQALETVTTSTENTVSHGKKNLATVGGKKK